MEQENEQLKQTLIHQYSNLSQTSFIALTEKLQKNDWWSNEQSRLKLQNTVSVIGSCVVFLGCCLIFVFTSFNGSIFPGTLSIPIISFAGLIFGLLITQKVQSDIKEKIRLFELLQIAFDNKKSEAEHAIQESL